MRWLDALARKARPGDTAAVADRMAETYDASSRDNYARALEICGPLAQAGVARAQNNIGACFSEGLGVERDLKLAAQWLNPAAAAGDAVGPRNCTALHFKGDRVEQDCARAMELYRASAAQGDGPAQDMLSWMLFEGEVADPDYIAAREVSERADGQAMLGAALHLGAGVAGDPVEAFVWLTRGCAGGSAHAGQFNQAVRAALTGQIADAERRAAAPLPEPPS